MECFTVGAPAGFAFSVKHTNRCRLPACKRVGRVMWSGVVFNSRDKSRSEKGCHIPSGRVFVWVPGSQLTMWKDCRSFIANLCLRSGFGVVMLILQRSALLSAFVDNRPWSRGSDRKTKPVTARPSRTNPSAVDRRADDWRSRPFRHRRRFFYPSGLSCFISGERGASHVRTPTC